MPKNNFESPPGEIIKDELPEEERIERDPRLVSLWKQYKFMGEPPVKGSPVEARLISTCEKYMRYLASPEELYEKTSMMEDSENYFAKKKPAELPKSDSSRRELHNQIALMVEGRQRSGMPEKRAIEIADFACRIVYGHGLEEMGMNFR